MSKKPYNAPCIFKCSFWHEGCLALEGILRGSGWVWGGNRELRSRRDPGSEWKWEPRSSDAHLRPCKTSTRAGSWRQPRLSWGKLPTARLLQWHLLSVMSLFSLLAIGPLCESWAIALYSRGEVGVEGPRKGPLSGSRKGQGSRFGPLLCSQLAAPFREVTPSGTPPLP